MGVFDAAWLYATIRVSTPLVFASMGEVVAQRAGVINIGLEGMMLTGALSAFIATWLTGSLLLGVVSGALAGALLACIMAALTIDAKADQIVVGVGILILAIGLTTFIDQEIFAVRERVFLDRMAPVPLPGLSVIPILGPLLFNHIPLVYLAYGLVPVVWFVMFRTSLGISIRACGETPQAADTAGVSVRGVRWGGTVFAGTMAGIGGAFLSVAQLGLFVENMSAGRGFLALAAVFFGKWNPMLIVLGCLLFGAANALQLRLQPEPFVPSEVWLVLGVAALLAFVAVHLSRRQRPSALVTLGVAGIAAGAFLLAIIGPPWDLASQLWLALPYVLALVVLGGVVGRSHMPSTLGIPYDRGGER